MRVVSVAYLGLMPDVPRPLAGTDAAEARFWPIADLWADDAPTLAFDHGRIVADGVERARAKLEYTSLATGFHVELLERRGGYDGYGSASTFVRLAAQAGATREQRTHQGA